LPTLIVVIAIVLCVIGIVGCILPGLPGTIFNYIALLLVHFSDATPQFSIATLVLFTIATAVAMGIEYVLPMLGTKQLGGSKYGAIGAGVGLIVGLFFMPIGIIVGPLAGATLAELAIQQKELPDAFKAGVGAVIGVFFSSVTKLTIACIITVFVMRNIF